MLGAQQKVEMLRLVEEACVDTWRADRIAGWVGIGVASVMLAVVGSMMVSRSSWLPFALVAGGVLGFSLLLLLFIQRRRNGTRHPVYRVLHDRASDLLSVDRISTPDLDILCLRTREDILQLHVSPSRAATLLLAIQRGLRVR